MSYSNLIETHELARLQKESAADQQPVVIDCRFDLANTDTGEQSWMQSHLPNASYAHLDRDLASEVTSVTGRHPLPDVEELVNRLEAWGISNDSQVVVYDDMSGAFAVRLWWMLRWLGHTKVAVLNGGWQKWIAEQRPLENTAPQTKPGHFKATTDNLQWLDKQSVAEGLEKHAITLVDARTAERFDGITEPIDRIAGHVPGAINHPFQNNLDEAGCFLPADALREQYNRLLGDSAAESVVHMCGSGVTSIHNMLAMEIAGMHGSKLYVGSWSEWIRDM
ncbi:sulfurtransferase [Solemya velum gill symbiont]|uniref:sulfurtransferase n=1 Tax=Solemya velum gill symbiont TaxID=2340 RepID=UPI0009971512|nr:sulfurtransferase [Solemya velum gill symbiont]OOZ61878.1 sulfurtransferase [Solemya velum gill symbiont]